MAISVMAVGFFGLVIAVGVFLSNLLRPKLDPREPPIVHPKVPFLGHVIGMLREGPLYYKRVRYASSPWVFEKANSRVKPAM